MLPLVVRLHEREFYSGLGTEGRVAKAHVNMRANRQVKTSGMEKMLAGGGGWERAGEVRGGCCTSLLARD